MDLSLLEHSLPVAMAIDLALISRHVFAFALSFPSGRPLPWKPYNSGKGHLWAGCGRVCGGGGDWCCCLTLKIALAYL
jgi:hypothetical protein